MKVSVGRYMAGLCVAALGLCAGGWLMLTPFAFGFPDRGRAALTALSTGAGLAVVCAATLACWALAWRRKLRADGVLPVRSSRRSRRSARRQARAERLVRASRKKELEAAPDPAQVLTDLRALLTPLLAGDGSCVTRLSNGADTHQVDMPGHLRPRQEPDSPAPRPEAHANSAEPLLRGAELLMVGTGEEEAW